MTPVDLALFHLQATYLIGILYDGHTLAKIAAFLAASFHELSELARGCAESSVFPSFTILLFLFVSTRFAI